MSIRPIKVKSNDPFSAEDHKNVIMIPLKTLIIFSIIFLLITITVSGYIYARFKEKTRIISANENLDKEQRKVLSQLMTDNDTLSRLLKIERENKNISKREKYLEVNGKAGELHIEINKAFENKNFEKVLALAEQAESLPSISTTIKKNIRGKTIWSLFYISKYDKALELINKALIDDPENYAYRQRKADILLIKKEYEKAKALILPLAKKSPTPSIIFSRANLYWGLKDFEKAIIDFQTVLACGITTHQRAAVNNLSLLYAEDLKDFRQANYYMTMLIRLWPNNKSVFSTGGRIMLLEGRLKKSEQYLLKAIEINPNHLDSILNLSILYKLKGNKTKAENLLFKAENLSEKWAEKYKSLLKNINFNQKNAPKIQHKSSNNKQ